MLVPPRSSAIVSKVVVELHRKKQAHQHNAPKSCRCDIHSCQFGSRVRVVRALSRKFHVNSKGKEKLTSRVVLAEVRLSDFETEAEARKAVRKLAQPARPLTIERLARIKRPIEHGYTEDEVYMAMRRYIMRHAKMYSNNSFPLEDAEQAGWVGVRSATLTDRAWAPFATHAYLHIRTKIRRPIYEGGLIKHGEREADGRGTKGGFNAFKWTCKQCGRDWAYNNEDKDAEKVLTPMQKVKLKQIKKEKDREKAKQLMVFPECYGSRCSGNKDVYKVKVLGSLTSVDAELGDSFTLKDAMASTDPGPLEIVMERDIQEHRRNVLFGIIIPAADLSDQQLDTLEHLFGLNGKTELSGTEAAKEIGNSRQRVGQQRKKCLEKLRTAADDLGYDLELIFQE